MLEGFKNFGFRTAFLAVTCFKRGTLIHPDIPYTTLGDHTSEPFKVRRSGTIFRGHVATPKTLKPYNPTTLKP